MRTLLAILAVACLLSCGPAQTKAPAVAQVRQEVEAIRRALPAMAAESSIQFGFSVEGGELIAYRDPRGEVRFLRAELFGESGSALYELYYRDGGLISSRREDRHYNVPFYFTPERAKESGDEAFDPAKTKVTEEFHDFDHGVMIRFQDAEGRSVAPGTAEFRDEERDLLTFSNELLARIAPRRTENAMTQIQPGGFLALPDGGRGPGDAVLVLHPWWGLNDTIRSFCQRLAEEGFVVFAPDLYHGKVTDTIAGAESLSSALFRVSDQAKAEVAAAAKFVDERAGRPGGGVAVIGFSMGAFYALDLSAADPGRIHSVVIFYGTGPADFTRAKAAYLGHFADKDAYESQTDIGAMERALRAAGRPATFHRYPGTGHWFFESDVEQAFDPAATQLAWERTLAFLLRERGTKP